MNGYNQSANFKANALSVRCKPVLEISINHKCYSICYSKFECKYTHIHTYTQKHSHTYIQTYSHTHTHTHTHIYVHKYSYCTYLNFAKMAIEFGIIKSHAIQKKNMQNDKNYNNTNIVNTLYSVLWIILIHKILST